MGMARVFCVAAILRMLSAGPAHLLTRYVRLRRAARALRSPVYLPYIYYKQARQSYSPHQLVGDNLSTPKKGQCSPGTQLGTNGCTWQRYGGARALSVVQPTSVFE